MQYLLEQLGTQRHLDPIQYDEPRLCQEYVARAKSSCSLRDRSLSHETGGSVTPLR